MKIYLSGPIAGYPDRNEPAFREAEAAMKLLRHEPVVPLDIPAFAHDGPCPPGYDYSDGHSSACYLRGDLAVLIQCDALYMMCEWQRSRGASLEHRVAVECGLRVFYWNSRDTVPYNLALTASDTEENR